MGVLITTTFAGLLAVLNVITVETYIVICAAVIMWAILAMISYFMLGWFKFFYHDFLGWHTPDDSPRYSDGCSQHATCKHCGNDIMMDSQGNWFC